MSARGIVESAVRFYDPQALWLHGSSAEFTQFKLGGKGGWDAGGIFLVKDTQAQEAYARSYGEKLYRCRVKLQPDQVFELMIPEHVERVLEVETDDAIGRDFMRSAEEGQRYGHVDWATLDQEVLELAGFKGCILAERPKGFSNFTEDILSLCVFDPSAIDIVGRVDGRARDVVESESGGVVDGKIFYHGARPGNAPFKSNEIRIPKGDAAYFSTDRDYAAGYADELFPEDAARNPRPHPGQLHSVYLTIRNPKIFNPDDEKEFEAFTYRGFNRSELEAQGYDSVMAVFPAHNEWPEEIQVGVFKPSQVTPIKVEPPPPEAERWIGRGGAKEVIESVTRPYGYWIDRSGNMAPVAEWGLHSEVANDLLAALYGGRVETSLATASLQRHGYVRVAGVSGLGHEGENQIYADTVPMIPWENLTRAQRERLEELAERTGKPLVFNTSPVSLPHFVIGEGARRVVESEMPEVLYHVTYANRLDSIGERGLQPNQERSIGAPSYDSHARGRVFLSDARGVSLWAQRAEEFAIHNSDDPRADNLVPVVLRVQVPQEVQDDEEGTRDSGGRAWFVTQPIPPENIEVWDGSKWSDQVPDAVLAACFDGEGWFVRDLPTVPRL